MSIPEYLVLNSFIVGKGLFLSLSLSIFPLLRKKFWWWRRRLFLGGFFFFTSWGRYRYVCISTKGPYGAASEGPLFFPLSIRLWGL